jgi:hypothetical protein
LEVVGRARGRERRINLELHKRLNSSMDIFSDLVFNILSILGASKHFFSKNKKTLDLPQRTK